MIVALFDIEGTLFTSPMGYGFIRYARLNGRRGRALRYHAGILPHYLAYKMKLLPEKSLFRTAIERMAWLVQGYDLDQAAKAFDWVVDEFILPSGRADVLARWEHHRQQGHHLVIVSSGLRPCVERIGKHLGAFGVVGTEVEVREGRYTGRVVSPVVIGEKKGEYARRFFDDRNLEIDWNASYAYADSINDLSLFTLVGNPVVTYGDAQLLEVAQDRGWTVMGRLRGDQSFS